MPTTNMVEIAQEQIEGTTLNISFQSTQSQGIMFFSESPRQRTISYRSYDRKYTLHFPWVIYAIEYYPQFNNGTWFLHSMFFSHTAPHPGIDVFYPTIPNFDKSYPCVASLSSRRNNSIPEMIGSFWNEKFNRDGRLARNTAWRRLANYAGVTPGKREDVFQYWETLDLPQYMAQSQPGAYPRRIL